MYFHKKKYLIRIDQIDGPYWAQTESRIGGIQRFYKRHSKSRNIKITCLKVLH